jgi:hypothetical protein
MACVLYKDAAPMALNQMVHRMLMLSSPFSSRSSFPSFASVQPPARG